MSTESDVITVICTTGEVLCAHSIPSSDPPSGRALVVASILGGDVLGSSSRWHSPPSGNWVATESSAMSAG